ncbi:hypothetical protein LCGC14_1593140 [marine sediment metagenome]|uniref:Ribbon-helix-helix protein CopG domain-containing protein n=1 Tax=marine sediment metagenome TaxID=412755 RepID=A0A0F9KU44_9ZZZZ|nr:MAG: hypothetical protein HeimC2_30920 [Candidatus Heimdallarchaeota archaeon LC_2]
MATTIQVSDELKKELKSRKFSESETYEDIIWDLIEDSLELSKETLIAIEESKKDYLNKRTISHEELKRELAF